MKSRYLGRNKSAYKPKSKTAVLLTNLGTPSAPTSSALRVYLREFLSDPRVVEIPRLLWMIILHGVVLRVRPAKSAKLYQTIWTEQGSPLLTLSNQLKHKVEEQLQSAGHEDLLVEMAMRYGQPSIADALNKFREQDIDKLIVLPLYPQYAGPTTASTFDAVVDKLKQWRWVPSLHFINGYYDNPSYINALANTINEHIALHGKPDKLVLSYHGMPQYFLESGDPYYCFCKKTTELLIAQLGLSEDDYLMTFQSRFGKAQWLQPYTDQSLIELAKAEHKHVAVISPAFSVDCLETLEELEHENRAIFLDAGGQTYHYIAALNDRDDHCLAISELIKQQISAG